MLTDLSSVPLGSWIATPSGKRFLFLGAVDDGAAFKSPRSPASSFFWINVPLHLAKHSEILIEGEGGLRVEGVFPLSADLLAAVEGDRFLAHIPDPKRWGEEGVLSVGQAVEVERVSPATFPPPLSFCFRKVGDASLFVAVDLEGMPLGPKPFASQIIAKVRP